MYPTISHLIKDWFGVDIPLPIQSYGFFVAMAFLVNIYFIVSELKRKEKEGLLSAITKKVTMGSDVTIQEWLSSVFFGFLIGWKGLDAILRYGAFVDNPQHFILSWEGNILGGLLGIALAVYMKYAENKKNKKEYPKPKLVTQEFHPHELVGTLMVVAAVAGIIGSKIFHNLENIDDLIADPVGALVSFSGLSFLGGLLVAGAALVWYSRRNGIPSMHLADAVAPTMALGYGIGRMGCQVSGDGCWGISNPNPKPDWMNWLPDWMWSYDYPNNVINVGHMIKDCSGKYCHALETPVFPTPLYETLMMVTVFIFLWSIRKHIKIPGMLFTIYFTLAGVERLVIEQVRINNKYHIMGFEITQAEIISTVMILAGLTATYLLYKYRKTLKVW